MCNATNKLVASHYSESPKEKTTQLLFLSSKKIRRRFFVEDFIVHVTIVCIVVLAKLLYFIICGCGMACVELFNWFCFNCRKHHKQPDFGLILLP